MSDMIKINASEMAEAFRRLEQQVTGNATPLKKVIRNEARDFTRKAEEVTPVAIVSYSPYFLATSAKDPKHQWYIHESMLAGRADLHTKSGNWKKFGRINKDGGTQLRRASVKKGYSRATWAGAFASLGLPPKNETKKYPKAADGKSYAIQRDLPDGPEVEIADMVAFDRFGKASSDPQHEKIIRAGFANAAAHLSSAYNRLLREAWKK